MGKDKLRKFAEIATFDNVYQREQGLPFKGQWAEKHFKNNNPVVLELACGKGEYTVNLAQLFPDKNFIGIDLKGNRLWRGAKTAVEENIPNVAFLRIQIEAVMDYFGQGEIEEIWITFADPQPREGKEKKRLTSSVFLPKYKAILAEGAKINLKTDSDLLYSFTKEMIEQHQMLVHKDTDHLYQSEFADEVLSIKTHYEKIYLKKDKNINYIQFSFS